MVSHDREFVYKPRGFNSIQEHDEAIIERWNNLVTDGDVVFILGDLMLKDNNHGIECIKRLKGYKKILIGNHDTDARIELYRALPHAEVLGFADRIRLQGHAFYISHYPTITANPSDDEKGLKVSTLNLYGHTHQQTNFFNDIPMNYHCGMDSHNCTPVSIDTIIEDIYAKFRERVEML